MPLILSRARAAGRAPALGLGPKLGRPIRPALWKANATVIARRYLNDEAQKGSEARVADTTRSTPTGSDLLWTTQSIADLRLQKEFEEKRDIKDYLRKWLEITPTTLDPIRESGTPPPPAANVWLAKLATRHDENAQQESTLARAEEEMSEYTDIGNESEGTDHYLQPGDLVAFKFDDHLRFGIYVQSVKKQQQFYTRTGRWRIAHPADVDFVVKGFTTPESVAPLIPYFPDGTDQTHSDLQYSMEGGVPRETGAHLLRMIDDFNTQTRELYRVNSARFDQIYDVVADDKKHLQMTLEELACEALGIEPDQVNDVIRFAVHRAVQRCPFLMSSDRSSLFSNQYVVYPTPVANVLKKVVGWYRQHQSFQIRDASEEGTAEMTYVPLHRFISKAIRIVRQSRKIRSPTTMASVGPSSKHFVPGEGKSPLVYRETPSEDFTDDDKIIIKFLQMWCIPPYRMASATLQSAASYIMRETGMYGAMDLNSRAGPLFLQELGVFTPWENIRLLDQDIALPGHDLGSDAIWDEVEGACDKLIQERPYDQMGHIRTHWQDLPVYCIDAVDAQEIDDGVSLERIPGSDDTFWIRVHIANPTAFIGRNHVALEYAASRLQTVYTPERTYPMLPKNMTQELFSLGPDRPCLTFSAKMNLQGEVLETDVRNGTVGNVIYITHDKLRSLFGVETSESEPLVVGGQLNGPSREELRDTLTSEDEDTFNTLRQLMLAFREQRLKNGAMEWPQNPDTPVSVSFGNASPKPSSINPETGRHILGDPIIQLRPRNLDPHEVPDITKDNLVSLLMNLACWVSAKWCAKRNIPAVFDGTYYHPEYPKLTNKNMSQFGGEGFLNLSPPRGVSTTRPIPHVPLGLDAYLKSTSPLRRYTDIIAHYQIESALRYEHEKGSNIDAATEDGAAWLPFTREHLEDFIARSHWKRRRLATIDRASKQFWACMLLFRAFYFAECKLPETFECLVHRPSSQTLLDGKMVDDAYMGLITSLGVRCSIAVPPTVTGIDIFSVVEAKITGVNMGRSLVTMEATRVVRPFKRVEAA